MDNTEKGRDKLKQTTTSPILNSEYLITRYLKYCTLSGSKPLPDTAEKASDAQAMPLNAALTYPVLPFASSWPEP